ncbi:MAG: hypothetical protein AAF352_05825, partial [Pseudomonadota bacterium]
MAEMNLQVIISAIDRISAPVKKIRGALGGTQDAVERSQAAFKKMRGALGNTQEAMERSQAALAGMGRQQRSIAQLK